MVMFGDTTIWEGGGRLAGLRLSVSEYFVFNGVRACDISMNVGVLLFFIALFNFFVVNCSGARHG